MSPLHPIPSPTHTRHKTQARTNNTHTCKRTSRTLRPPISLRRHLALFASLLVCLPSTSNGQTNFLYKKPHTGQIRSLQPNLKLSGQTIENDGGFNRQGGVGRAHIHLGNDKTTTTKLPPQVETSRPRPNKTPSIIPPSSLDLHSRSNPTRTPSS